MSDIVVTVIGFVGFYLLLGVFTYTLLDLLHRVYRLEEFDD